MEFRKIRHKVNFGDCGQNLSPLIMKLGTILTSFFLVSLGRDEDVGGLGTLKMAAVIASPICFLCILVMIGLCVCQRREQHRRPYFPHPESGQEHDHLMPADATLHDLLEEWTHSGSGSGKTLQLNFVI